MIGCYDFCAHYEWTFAWLEKEGLGPAFIGYVASTWKNFVSD